MKSISARWFGGASTALLCAVGIALTAAAPAVAAEPVLISGPTISGVPQVGKVLTATDAQWNHDGFKVSPTEKVWDRCSGPDISSCVAIKDGSGLYADGTTYRLTAADLGLVIRRYNGYRTSVPSPALYSVWSAATATVTVDQTTVGKPVNTALPKITGTARVHKKLKASTGTWTGATPISFKYQWKKCNSKAKKCKSISGATKSSFTPGSKYAGKRLKVVVTAKNSEGSTSVTSRSTGTVKK
jgi:hypothetical protein